MTESFHFTPDDRIALLRRVKLFSSLPDADLVLLAETTGLRHLNAREVLFKAGDPADAAFIVVDGELSGQLPNGIERVRFHGADFLGEYALFTRSARTLTLTAVTDCLLLVLSHERLEMLLKIRPGVALEMLRLAVHKIVALESELSGRTASDSSPP